MNNFAEVYKVVKENEDKGFVTIMSIDGLMSMPIDEFIKQPTEGLLYDLNRDRLTTITLGSEGNVRWVNDYAMALVIEYLMKQLKEKNNE